MTTAFSPGAAIKRGAGYDDSIIIKSSWNRHHPRPERFYDDMTILPRVRARKKNRQGLILLKHSLLSKQSSYCHKYRELLNDDDFMTIKDKFNRHGDNQ